MIQRDWEPAGGGLEKWDELIDGVQWYRTLEGRLWYKDCNKDHRFSFWEGKEHAYTEDQWDKVEDKTSKPLPGHGPLEGELEQPQIDKALLKALEPISSQDVPLYEQSAKSLLPLLTEQLQEQTVRKNYDRLIYINQFLTFVARHPDLPLMEALYLLPLDSSSLAGIFTGGHCAALSGSLLGTESLGKVPSYLVASVLPKQFQQDFAPKYCHAGGVIKFANPEEKSDRGYILLEPGFNITVPIVVRPGKPFVLPQGQENWVFTLTEDERQIICQPQPASKEETWGSKKMREKTMVYLTSQLMNPDEAITKPLLGVDKRPPILARDMNGNVIGKVLVNYAKRWIEMAVGNTKAKPVPFEEVDQEGLWLKAVPGIWDLLKIEFSELAARVYQAVQGEAILAKLAKQIEVARDGKK